MTINPYNNNFKYNLSDDEIKLIDKIWQFIDDFRETKLNRNKYRKYIINKIKNDYTLDQFCTFEEIVEKMYWNLYYKIKDNYNFTSDIFIKRDFNLNNMENKILSKNTKIKESTVRKTYFITQNNHLLYKYEYPNDLDLLMSSIMINRSLYETIMGNSIDIYKIKIEPYNNIIEFDYPFPNLNTIKKSKESREKRCHNINKLYYENNSIENWF